MTKRLGIPVPEMIFGENHVSVSHEPSGWSVSFTAEAALDLVDKTGGEGMLQVAHAREWTSSRENSLANGIKEVVRPFDWTYTTSYRGTEKAAATSEEQGSSGKVSSLLLQPSTGLARIPIDRLSVREEIVVWEQVPLYDSELDDNGVSSCGVKFRVMREHMLLLCRNFMRVDNVTVRVRDTRIHVDFETGVVIREYKAMEANVEFIANVSPPPRQ
jgi:type 2A phosphatase activator TIP41